MLRAATRRAVRPSTTAAVARRSRPATTESPLLLPFLYPPTCTQSLYAIRESSSKATAGDARRNYATPAAQPSVNNARIQLMSGEWIGGYDPMTASKRTVAPPPRKTSSKPSLLILDHPKQSDGTYKRAGIGHRTRSGIAKNYDELLVTYEACIHVGRIARAQLMLNEITRLLADHTGLLVTAHNAFLKALLKRAQAEKTEDNIRVLFSWYEDTMVRKFDISPDATTMALLFSASLQLSAHLVGERYIKRWASEWEESGHKVKEILDVDVLTPEESIRVARVSLDQ